LSSQRIVILSKAKDLLFAGGSYKLGSPLFQTEPLPEMSVERDFVRIKNLNWQREYI
jgi:hypothetical protein